eukprot:COSAG06_NODE_383_length_16525_cov_86.720017_14_plen_534_part_00
MLLRCFVAITLKVPTKSGGVRTTLDWFLVITFIVLVPLAFVTVALLKFYLVNAALKATNIVTDDEDDSLAKSFTRFKLGLADRVDQFVLKAYAQRVVEGRADKHTSAGRRLWNSKLLVTHFDQRDMSRLLDELAVKMRLTKSEELVFHFTSKESAYQILQGHGIRASQEGQLGGGVSVCVWSFRALGWDKFRPLEFRQRVAAALWGKKADDLMFGGPFYDKLDAALVVRVPVDEKRDQGQYVPGRPAVYIIPPSSLEEEPQATAGTMFLSNTQIAACLILQPPSGKDGEEMGWSRVEATGEAGFWSIEGKTGGEQYTMKKLNKGARFEEDEMFAHEQKDREAEQHREEFVQRFTVKVAPPADRKSLVDQQHKYLEARDKDRSLWIEVVLRFTAEEMRAALESVDSQLSHNYSLAYYFCSKEDTERIIETGGIPSDIGLEAAGQDPVVRVTTRSPGEMGWGMKEAGGESVGTSFRRTAGYVRQFVYAFVYNHRFSPRNAQAILESVHNVANVDALCMYHSTDSTFLTTGRRTTR